MTKPTARITPRNSRPSSRTLPTTRRRPNNLEALYKQNTEIIAQSLREIQKFQREFES